MIQVSFSMQMRSTGVHERFSSAMAGPLVLGSVLVRLPAEVWPRIPLLGKVSNALQTLGSSLAQLPAAWSSAHIHSHFEERGREVPNDLS